MKIFSLWRKLNCYSLFFYVLALFSFLCQSSKTQDGIVNTRAEAVLGENKPSFLCHVTSGSFAGDNFRCAFSSVKGRLNRMLSCCAIAWNRVLYVQLPTLGQSGLVRVSSM